MPLRPVTRRERRPFGYHVGGIWQAFVGAERKRQWAKGWHLSRGVSALPQVGEPFETRQRGPPPLRLNPPAEAFEKAAAFLPHLPPAVPARNGGAGRKRDLPKQPGRRIFAADMKQAAPYIALIALVVALAVTLFVRNQNATERQKQDGAAILLFSNNLKEASVNLNEARGVISNLEKDVADRNTSLQNLTNEFTRTTNDLLVSLSQTRTDLESTRKADQAEIARRDARITDLEAQNLNLDRRATELTNALTELNTQIVETRRKLTSAQGDKAFLEGELKRLMADKAELEKKFNDLEVLRDQVKKLKEEIAISRRLEWIRKGIFANPERKGAELLMQKPAAQKPANTGTNYDLNVEVGSDGSVRVISPLPKPTTNAPAR